jgi:PIN domain nuclease of toxin-antitoxin system
MSLLLDTQIALWWQAGARRLSRGARAALESERGELWVSRGSLWEVAIKVSAGKLPIDVTVFAAQVEQFGFRWLDIRTAHLLEIAGMPLEDHRDPFDRLLVAQARVESLTLLTADRKLARYGAFVQVV